MEYQEIVYWIEGFVFISIIIRFCPSNALSVLGNYIKTMLKSKS